VALDAHFASNLAKQILTAQDFRIVEITPVDPKIKWTYAPATARNQATIEIALREHSLPADRDEVFEVKCEFVETKQKVAVPLRVHFGDKQY